MVPGGCVSQPGAAPAVPAGGDAMVVTAVRWVRSGGMGRDGHGGGGHPRRETPAGGRGAGWAVTAAPVTGARRRVWGSLLGTFSPSP